MIVMHVQMKSEYFVSQYLLFCFCCFCMQAKHVLFQYNITCWVFYNLIEKEKKRNTCVYFKDLTSAILNYLITATKSLGFKYESPLDIPPPLPHTPSKQMPRT